MSSKKPPEPAAFQTIDPTELTKVGGGAASSSSADTAVMTALTGILDSLQSLATSRSQSGGFDSQSMMLMMMMMMQNNQPQVVQAAAPALPPFYINGQRVY